MANRLGRDVRKDVGRLPGPDLGEGCGNAGTSRGSILLAESGGAMIARFSV